MNLQDKKNLQQVHKYKIEELNILAKQKKYEVNYKFMHETLKSLITEIRTTDKNILYFNGAIWSWILTNKTIINSIFLYYVPISISIMFLIKTIFLLIDYFKIDKKFKKSIGTFDKEKTFFEKWKITCSIYGLVILANIILLTFIDI